MVDSCIDHETGRPAALDYLKEIGVDPAESIRLVVITHWHEDHFRGVASIFRAARAAKLVCSAALNKKDFWRFVASARRNSMVTSNDGKELAELFALLDERAPEGARPPSIGPEWARANHRLFRASGQGRLTSEVWALSPSSATMTLGLNELISWLPKARESKRRPVSLSPNQIAIVLWINVGEISVLLGADLENSANPLLGWEAIVSSTERPPGRAGVVKVPHHGSSNADHPGVWATMLTESPCALVAPFSSGTAPLPRKADLARLLARTPELFCTAPIRGLKPMGRPSAVERTLREVAQGLRVVDGRMGHVRVRLRNDHPDRVSSCDLFGAAFRVRSEDAA